MVSIGNKKNYTLGIIDTADYTNDELYGGSTGYVKSILPYLKSNDVIIIGQGINGTASWKPICLSDKTEFIPIASFKFPSKIPLRLKALLAYARYRKKVLDLGVDVLYVHSPEVCLPYLFFNKKTPIIYHQHGFSNALHSSKYRYGEAWIFRKFFDIALWLIHKRADWIVTIDSIGLKQAAKNNAQDKTTLLLNAVNSKHFKPDHDTRKEMRSRLGLNENDFIIINTGRIEKQKGLQRLFACLPLLKSEGLKFHIFIAGDGTYKTRLENMVQTYGGSEEVTFLGRVPHEQLPKYYNMADVFVLPSEREGVPMAILEAMACGTPAVANAVGGIPIFLKNGVNGLLLDDLTHETIVSSIMEVYRSNYDRRQVSNSIDNLSAGNAVSILNNIIKSIVRKLELQ